MSNTKFVTLSNLERNKGAIAFDNLRLPDEIADNLVVYTRPVVKYLQSALLRRVTVIGVSMHNEDKTVANSVEPGSRGTVRNSVQDIADQLFSRERDGFIAGVQLDRPQRKERARRGRYKDVDLDMRNPDVIIFLDTDYRHALLEFESDKSPSDQLHEQARALDYVVKAGLRKAAALRQREFKPDRGDLWALSAEGLFILGEGTQSPIKALAAGSVCAVFNMGYTLLVPDAEQPYFDGEKPHITFGALSRSTAGVRLNSSTVVMPK